MIRRSMEASHGKWLIMGIGRHQHQHQLPQPKGRLGRKGKGSEKGEACAGT